MERRNIQAKLKNGNRRERKLNAEIKKTEAVDCKDQ